MSDTLTDWLNTTPYCQTLGVSAEPIEPERTLLHLPYREANSNPGGVLHGGVAASLSVIGGHAIIRQSLGAESGPWHTAGFQINYLAAAIEETVTAEARLLRRGRELCFVEVYVRSAAGKPISQATLALHARFANPSPTLYRSSGDDGGVDPGPMGKNIGAVNFIGARGIEVELMRSGASRLRMPFSAANASAEGTVHEGAALALLDTTGAMAAWAETGPGAYKASTPAIQAQVLTPPPKGDLVAYGRVCQRDNELFWTDVEVAEASSGQVHLRGTVLYRILT